MKRTVSSIQTVLIPAVFLAFAAPSAFGQTLSVNPTSMQFPHISTQFNPQTATVSTSNGQPAALSRAITYTQAPGGVNENTPQWLSVTPTTTGTPFSVIVNTAPNGVSLVNGNYTANVLFSATGFGSVSLPVSLTVTGSSGGGVSSGVVSTTSLNLTSSSPTASFNINTPIGTTYTVQSPQYISGTSFNWLTVSSFGGVAQFTSTPITVTAQPSFLPQGSYTALIPVSANGQSATVTVNLTVGVGGGGSTVGFTVLPTSLNFAAPAATSNDPNLVQNNNSAFSVTSSVTQNVDFRSTTTSGANWLSTNLVNGVTLTAGLQIGVNVVIDPRGLAAGQYTGNISMYRAGTFNLLGSVQVNLTIGSSSNFVFPQSVTHSAAAGSTAAQSLTQTITVSGNGTYTIGVTNNTPSGGNWFYVTSSGGTATPSSNGSFNITVTPENVPVGTYTGSVAVTFQGQQPITIPVTLTVGTGTGGGGVVTPNPIFLSTSFGVPTSTSFTIAPSFATNWVIDTPGVSWLSLSQTSGFASPTSSVVITTNNSAQVGTNTTQLTVRFPNTSLPQVTVPVTLTVANTGTGSSSFSPSQLSFTSAVNGPSTTLTATLNGAANTFFSASASTTTGVNWLSVTPFSGSTSFAGSASLNVTANPFGLAEGTYSGQVNVSIGGFNQALPVTLQVGQGGTGVLLSPTFLTFNVAQGSSSSQLLQLSLTPGTFYNLTPSTGTGVQWLSVSPLNGAASSSVTPITVQVNTFGLAAGSYSGQVQATAGGLTQTVPITLVVGGGGSGGTGGLVSPSSLSFTAGVGGPNQVQSLNIAATAGTLFQVNLSTTSGGNWLFASPTNGFVGQNVLNVGVSPSEIAIPGTYSGQVVVTVAGNTQTIPVTLTVGTGGGTGGFVSPSSLTFSSLIGGSTQSQVLNLTTSAGAFYSAQASTSSGLNWLSVSPTSGTAFQTLSQLTVTANPSGLAAGTYTGQINVVSGSLTQTIPVTFTVGSTGSGIVSPTSLNFSSIANGGSQSQNLLLSTSVGTFYNASATTSSGGTWLFVSPTSGNASSSQTNLVVTVNPFGLANGNYSGQVNLVVGGQSVSVPVTLAVGTGGGSGLVTPTTLSFNIPVNGSAQTQTLSINAQVGSFYSVNSTVSNSVVNWLLVSPNNGVTNSTVTNLSVTASPLGLAAGTYNGQITVTVGSQTATIPVTMTIGSGGGTGNFTAAPASLTFTAGSTPPAAQTIQVTSAFGVATFIANASVTTGQNWLQVSPTAANTPAQLTVNVNPSGLAAGTYQGSITLTVGGAQVLQIPVTLTVTQSAQMTIRRVQNAASYAEVGVTPGMIVLLDVENLGGPSQIANLQLTGQNTVATTLANTRVLFDGVAAPLIYVVNNFVSAIVPYEVGSRAFTTIVVEARGARSADYQARVLDAAPGVFTSNASGTGQGSISNADGSANSPSNPALRRPGQFAVIYFTGEGGLNPAGVTGGLAPVSPLRATVNDVQIRVGGRPAQKIFAGAVPTLIYGLGHASFFIPDDAPTGSAVPVEVIIGGRSSQANVTMAIAP